jgi:hypothetical protein
MHEIRNDLNSTGTNSILPIDQESSRPQERGTVGIIREHRLEELPQDLQAEGLTSMKLLRKSGNILIESMDSVSKLPEHNVMEVVEMAKALSLTVQTQANLFKALKDFKK